MKTIITFTTVLILSVFMMGAGTSRVITGTVTDEQGYPVIGATVTVKNSSAGTVSGRNGEYTLTVPGTAKFLVFSYPGMETKEVAIRNRTVIDVSLKTASTEMDEVVVVGYGTAAEASTGSVRSRREHARVKRTSTHAYTAAPQKTVVHNTESYATIRENGFKDVLHNPLSTFSIDVDKASYSNVRRFINMGQRPPVDAVRVEELINYFSYDYPEPDGKHPFSVSTELSECPWNGQHQLLQIGLQGKRIDKSELPPSNLVFLIDVSGSMRSHNKLPLLKSAFRMLVSELRSADRVAIVVYAGAAGLVLESTPGDEKATILQSIQRLQSGGSTAGGAGLKLAYRVAEEHFIEEGNNRIILATDGDFNVGPSSDAEMERMIEKKRENGVFMTVLGFGMGNYKDSKMETIADKGNGNYAYIDNIQEANKVFVSEFGGTLFTIARDVKFQIEFNPARVKSYRLVGYENRLLNDEDFNDDTKDAGEMGAGHTVTALYEIVPAGSETDYVSIDPLKYQSDRREVSPERNGELMTVKLRYKAPGGGKSTLYELPVQGEMKRWGATSDNFRFAASVAQFGMILRESEYVKEGTLDEVIARARKSRGEDPEGYRGEFINLVSAATSLLALNEE